MIPARPPCSWAVRAHKQAEATAVTDIEKRFAGHGDNGSSIGRQLLSRASVKRESRKRLIENGVPEKVTEMFLLLVFTG
jgi:hypothetical protein